jgi:hypothetical protein
VATAIGPGMWTERTKKTSSWNNTLFSTHSAKPGFLPHFLAASSYRAKRSALREELVADRTLKGQCLPEAHVHMLLGTGFRIGHGLRIGIKGKQEGAATLRPHPDARVEAQKRGKCVSLSVHFGTTEDSLIANDLTYIIIST